MRIFIQSLILAGVLFAGAIGGGMIAHTAATNMQSEEAKPLISPKEEKPLRLKHLIEIQNCFYVTEWVVFIFNDRTNIYYYPTLVPALKQFVDANSDNTVKLRPDRGNCA